jgi:isopentenyl diphosphate isomerase/L-lactate dehydrogenase-like FMN-dependent dehydrogenase
MTGRDDRAGWRSEGREELDMTEQIKQRKTEHVNISLQNDISAPQAASWADIRLVHRALPEVDLEAIDLSVDFLGSQLRHPLWISSLTGGHPDVAAINEKSRSFNASPYATGWTGINCAINRSSAVTLRIPMLRFLFFIGLTS